MTLARRPARTCITIASLRAPNHSPLIDITAADEAELVAMLQHVFDPPPDRLTVPWGFLAALWGAAIVGGAVAVGLASKGLARLRLGAILREE